MGCVPGLTRYVCLSEKRAPWEIIVHLMESQLSLLERADALCVVGSWGAGGGGEKEGGEGRRREGRGEGRRGGEIGVAPPLRVRRALFGSSSPNFVQIGQVFLPCVTYTFPSLIISDCIQECLTLNRATVNKGIEKSILEGHMQLGNFSPDVFTLCYIHHI